jgi:hypothetical protein
VGRFHTSIRFRAFTIRRAICKPGFQGPSNLPKMRLFLLISPPVQRSLRSPRYIFTPYPTLSIFITMRVSIVLAALAAVASASSVAKRQIPSCALGKSNRLFRITLSHFPLECMTSADTGSCAATDNTCLCGSDKFVQSTYSCISSTCSGSDLQSAVAAARALCVSAVSTLNRSISISLIRYTRVSP